MLGVATWQGGLCYLEIMVMAEAVVVDEGGWWRMVEVVSCLVGVESDTTIDFAIKPLWLSPKVT